MKKIIIFNPRRGNLQKQFDEAIADLDAELKKGNDCNIVLESVTGKQVIMVEGYFGIDADCKGIQFGPQRWFNKKLLNDLDIYTDEYEIQ